MKLDIVFRRRWLLFYLPVLLLSAFLLRVSFTDWLPLPPRTVTMASGVPGGGYTRLALQYRQKLDAWGINTSLVTTESAHSAKALLFDETQADVALVNGLVAAQQGTQSVQALAAIEREPIWVFTRPAYIDRLEDLRGLRIGVPLKDQLQEKVLSIVLNHAELQRNEVTVVPLSRDTIVNTLIDGGVDAVVLMGSARNEVVSLLPRSAGIHLIGMNQVGKLMLSEPSLRPFVLPQGVIEFRGDVPSRDLMIVAADLHLVIRPEMHPALQRALLQVASQIHEIPTFLQHQGEFPSFVGMDYPISPTALAASRGNMPWLEQLLPYWWAQLAQWLLMACLPILTVTLLLLAWIPRWFEWRVNAVLQNFYGELKFLETDIENSASERPMELNKLLQRLDEMEIQIMQLELPNRYVSRWYTLRSHLVNAREKLLNVRSR
jgi:TRAP-type uncharacterized transport system substrate-binding protein